MVDGEKIKAWASYAQNAAQPYLLPAEVAGRIASAMIANSEADLNARFEAALDLAVRYGGIDGEHHKTWVIDQMVRALAGDGYDDLVRESKDGEDGPDTYDWDVGIPP